MSIITTDPINATSNGEEDVAGAWADDEAPEPPDVADPKTNGADEREPYAEYKASEERQRQAVREARFAEWVTPAPSIWCTEAPPRRTWLLRDSRHPKSRGVLPLGKVGQLMAAGGAGKTMVFCQLAVAVATGTPWLGCLTVASPGRVLLILAEEDIAECERRLHHASKAANQIYPDVMIDVIAGHGRDPRMVIDDQHRNFAASAFAEWLADYCKAGDYRLVCLDPLSRFAGREAEKDNAAATRFVQAVEAITPPTQTTLIGHHTHQQARGSGSKLDASASRGVTGLVDGPRWQCALAVEELTFESAEEQERLGEVVTWSVTKSNYAMKPRPILLRRDNDHNGALVPVAADDLERIEAARAKPTGQEARKADAKQRAQDTKEAREDEAVRAAVREHPGLSTRDLTTEVQARAHCGRDRAVVAIARMLDELDVREGARKARLHYPLAEEPYA